MALRECSAVVRRTGALIVSRLFFAESPVERGHGSGLSAELLFPDLSFPFSRL
jgi:hypothetical protein